LVVCGAASAQTPTGETVEEVVVTGRRLEESGYRAERSDTGTRIDAALRDVPASIQVIPRQVIVDQALVRVGDAVRNVSGVVQSPGVFDQSDDYLIRGFPADRNLRNGFPDAGVDPMSDISYVERVEVLKGPASFLYGQVEPGGVVNVVTKRPTEAPAGSATLVLGSRDFRRAALDVSGPVGPGRALLGRLNLAHQAEDSHVDFTGARRLAVAAAFAWMPSAATRLDISADYLRSEQRGFPRLLFRSPNPLNRVYLDLPRSRYLGEPDDFAYYEQWRGDYVLTHELSRNWTLRHQAQALHSRNEAQATLSLGLRPDGRTLTRRVTGNANASESYRGQFEVVGRFATGRVGHDLLLGLELARERFTDTENSFAPPLGRPSYDIDIFEPVYRRPRGAFVPIPSAPEHDGRRNTAALVLQDQIALSDAVKLLVGGRFDRVESRSTNLRTGETIGADDEAFSPRAGLVWQPDRRLALYASYGRSFKTALGNFLPFDRQGAALSPTQGEQYEAGAKLDLLGGRLSATAAAYSITKTNIRVPDPREPQRSLAAGEARSRGVEFDIAGEIRHGWHLIGSLAHTDAQITEDTRLPVGSRLIGVPAYAASIWTAYRVQEGSWRGFGLGAGVRHQSAVETSLPNAIRLPAFTTVDATLFYETARHRFALSARNLLDEKYWLTNFIGDVYVRPPLTVTASVSSRW